MTLLHYVKYRDKLKGCYIGKAIGCALGKPYEGKVGIRPVDGYDPVPAGMPENDGFDFQAVWLEVLRRKGLPVNRYDLSQGWKEHIRMAWDEYGAAERDLAGRLYPPLSGSFDNKFSDGMGGAARAELWASIAPGDPALAAKLAAEDACIDHSGDGIYAAQFLAALESTTYVICDVQELIRTGLSCIPKKSRLAAARFLSAHRPISRLRSKKRSSRAITFKTMRTPYQIFACF